MGLACLCPAQSRRDARDSDQINHAAGGTDVHARGNKTGTPLATAVTPWFCDFSERAVGSAAEMILPPGTAALLLSTTVLLATGPDLRVDDVSGSWTLTETRAGNRCTGTLTLQNAAAQTQPSQQTVLGTQRGSARFSGPCVDPASGTWTAQDGELTGPRLAAKLEYDKSSVFYSLALDRSRDGTLVGKGEIYASPRRDPEAVRRVGVFDARQERTR